MLERDTDGERIVDAEHGLLLKLRRLERARTGGVAFYNRNPWRRLWHHAAPAGA